MRALRFVMLLAFFSVAFSSCSLWNKAFPPKYGCGTDGRNVGAEKLLDENTKQKKPPKFKG